MPSFEDHADVLQLLKDSQEADHDNREKVREANLFVDKRDGQWEPYYWNQNSGKPRYTFDMSSPVVDQIAGEMEQADFNITVRPAGGDATKDLANVYDGLIRNIENISNATHIFNQSGRLMVTGGMDGWRVVQRFVDGNSFDQDLMIEKISNFVDRVWFDASAEMQDRSDAKFCFVLQGLSKAEYKEKYPKGSEQSITTDHQDVAYYYKPDLVMVAEFYYIKEVERELVLMSNGRVYEVNEDFNKVSDELKDLGIKEERRRTRKKNKVFVRQMDNKGWLNDAKETVFSYIPVIPTYGNFKIFENKTIYWGVIDKLIDPQRVMNYSMSREIEEGALAPRAKYWMTDKQVAGHESTLATMNTNSDPVQTYTPDPAVPGPPQQSGGAQINPGLRTISESMRQIIGQSAGMFAANMGDNPGLQSGVAIRQLQNKGDIGTIKYFQAQEVAICHTARILVDAIPKVYDTQRQIRLLNEDGSFEMVALNESVIDQESGETVTLNDLSQGTYDVTCSAGPAFKNRQEETVTAITEMSQVDPTIVELGADVLLNNVKAPGMDKIAERKRKQLFEAGAIPLEQLTEEELQVMNEQANNPPQPDPALLLAEAENKKAEADLLQIQVKIREQDIQLAKQEADAEKDDREASLKIQKMEQDLILSLEEQNRKDAETAAKIEEIERNFVLAIKEEQRKTAETISSIQKEQTEMLKVLREAIGADTIIGPHNTAAYIEQAEKLSDGDDLLEAVPDNNGRMVE